MLGAKGNQLDFFASKNVNGGEATLRPALKLAVLQAPESDKAHINDVALCLEQMMQAVESQETAGFSLVERLAELDASTVERNSQLLKGSHLRLSVQSADDRSELSQPRY